MHQLMENLYHLQILKNYILDNNNFFNEIVESVILFVDTTYFVAPNRENRIFSGFSLGSPNSLYIGYKRSDLFGFVGFFSPSLGVAPSDDDFNGSHKGLSSKEEELRAEIPLIFSLISCRTDDNSVDCLS
ncbi:hypothetical protein BCR32DRAFT_245883 [Anaeromyces robustus]|uniref:Uncharacterized protein n=1 Tax=Anaeromyces robustus TaxID=1754192 RepID=A0A1Y1X2N6_9FUNG|nr:hypothetical protein BCR32DRAFT_245883 [Anaeromyces robustus]|eukprot:ORX80070.1 hypothetical protein BCR32DRAFT_245883 [Anaeromyces robustus]